MAKKNQALIKWEERLAQEAAAAQATASSIAGGGNFLSIKSGVLSYKGGEVPGNKMNVIVLDYILENGWNSTPYDPDNPQSPECYAFGRSNAEMSPHEKSASPQSETCAACDKNQFGSADRGKGKACANRVRLALITEGDMEDVENAEVAYLKVPPTSLKGWAGYVNQLAGVLHVPPFAAVTEISVIPDPKTQLKVVFKMVQQLDDGAVLEALYAKKETVSREIDFPYPDFVPVEKVASPRGRGRAAAPVTPAAKAAVRVGAGKAKY